MDYARVWTPWGSLQHTTSAWGLGKCFFYFFWLCPNWHLRTLRPAQATSTLDDRDQTWLGTSITPLRHVTPSSSDMNASGNVTYTWKCHLDTSLPAQATSTRLVVTYRHFDTSQPAPATSTHHGSDQTHINGSTHHLLLTTRLTANLINRSLTPSHSKTSRSMRHLTLTTITFSTPTT